MKKTTNSKTIEVGQVRLIPFKANKGAVLRVTCVVLELRQAYGRNEVKVAPIEGEGAVWITKDTALSAVRN